VDLSDYQREKYLSLTTFRPDGSAVATPVWFAEDAGALFVWTNRDSHKVRRLQHNSAVEITLCSLSGKPTRAPIAAIASLLSESESARVQELLHRKYGVQKRVWDMYTEASRLLRGKPFAQSAYLEVKLP
jgi:PPOX class probable F420-dependent enzyme